MTRKYDNDSLTFLALVFVFVAVATALAYFLTLPGDIPP